MSVERDRENKPYVETSELLRVFGELKHTSLNTQEYTDVDSSDRHPDYTALQALITAKDEELHRAWEMVAWLQSKLDAMETKALHGPTTNRRWWWPW